MRRSGCADSGLMVGLCGARHGLDELMRRFQQPGILADA